MASEQIDGQKLRARRHDRTPILTQGQLSVKSGVGQSIISRIERGVIKNVRLSTARQLADALGVKVDALLVKPDAGESELDRIVDEVTRGGTLSIPQSIYREYIPRSILLWR